jgi:hypothetical protein
MASFDYLMGMVVKMWVVARPSFFLEPSTPNESTWDTNGPCFPQSIHA